MSTAKKVGRRPGRRPKAQGDGTASGAGDSDYEGEKRAPKTQRGRRKEGSDAVLGNEEQDFRQEVARPYEGQTPFKAPAASQPAAVAPSAPLDPLYDDRSEDTRQCAHAGCPWVSMRLGPKDRMRDMLKHQQSREPHEAHVARDRAVCPACRDNFRLKIWDDSEAEDGPGDGASSHGSQMGSPRIHIEEGAHGEKDSAHAARAHSPSPAPRPSGNNSCGHTGCTWTTLVTNPILVADSLENHMRALLPHKMHHARCGWTCTNCMRLIEQGIWPEPQPLNSTPTPPPRDKEEDIEAAALKEAEEFRITEAKRIEEEYLAAERARQDEDARREADRARRAEEARAEAARVAAMQTNQAEAYAAQQRAQADQEMAAALAEEDRHRMEEDVQFHMSDGEDDGELSREGSPTGRKRRARSPPAEQRSSKRFQTSGGVPHPRTMDEYRRQRDRYTSPTLDLHARYVDNRVTQAVMSSELGHMQQRVQTQLSQAMRVQLRHLREVASAVEVLARDVSYLHAEVKEKVVEVPQQYHDAAIAAASAAAQAAASEMYARHYAQAPMEGQPPPEAYDPDGQYGYAPTYADVAPTPQRSPEPQQPSPSPPALLPTGRRVTRGAVREHEQMVAEEAAAMDEDPIPDDPGSEGYQSKRRRRFWKTFTNEILDGIAVQLVELDQSGALAGVVDLPMVGSLGLDFTGTAAGAGASEDEIVRQQRSAAFSQMESLTSAARGAHQAAAAHEAGIAEGGVAGGAPDGGAGAGGVGHVIVGQDQQQAQYGNLQAPVAVY